MLPGLCERDGFAHFVQKATAHFLFERFHRVADGGLREMKFPRGAGK